MIAVDTEVTGVDLWHGAMPYFVTTCDERGHQKYWEWDVDPLTREPDVPESDLYEIIDVLQLNEDVDDPLVFQNPKFDVRVLSRVLDFDWPWYRTLDTLLAGHLIASNQAHDLTTMALIYLGVNVEPYEAVVRKATEECRRKCRSNYKDWQIAKAGRADMPSAKGSVWKFDMWLPRAIAQEEGLPDDHPYWHVLSEYANADSAATVELIKVQRQKIHERGLERIYAKRLELLPIIYGMESRGVTLNADRKRELESEYLQVVEHCDKVCVSLSGGHLEELPKGVSNALKTTLFDHFGLESTKQTKKGNPSCDKDVLEDWSLSLPNRSPAKIFVDRLRDFRQRSTALTYMDGYEKFWLLWDFDYWGRNGSTIDPNAWYVLHPSLNPTGTDTLRWSSSNPNEQNISKKEGFNLRYVFGPAPGREWWSIDAKNIELRIPAYESGEAELIELFEQPDKPPYYGSVHLLNFSTVYPDIWRKELREVGLNKVGPHCKDKYASTWYQWCKNGDFAVQYGAVEREDSIGTADRAFHREGSHAKLRERFSKQDELNQKWIAFAERHGYVETLPDKSVDPHHGYPLLCSRSQWGGIKPTVPLNYHVQGTAMWWMAMAMLRTQPYLDELNYNLPEGTGYYMIMQVHDELVFDFPLKPRKGNLPIVREVSKLMEVGGEHIGVPTPVDAQYHPKTWSESE